MLKTLAKLSEERRKLGKLSHVCRPTKGKFDPIVTWLHYPILPESSKKSLPKLTWPSLFPTLFAQKATLQLLLYLYGSVDEVQGVLYALLAEVLSGADPRVGLAVGLAIGTGTGGSW
jgi:hypothetical protein